MAVALTVVIIDPDTVTCTESVKLECASQGRDPCLWTGACGPRPATATLRQWYAATPAGFLFAVKASHYITHMKKPGEPRKTLPPFLDRIRALDDKLGPILFQLPPRWHFNAHRLSEFLHALSREFRYAFEFRDRSWLNEQSGELLAVIMRHVASMNWKAFSPRHR